MAGDLLIQAEKCVLVRIQEPFATTNEAYLAPPPVLANILDALSLPTLTFARDMASQTQNFPAVLVEGLAGLERSSVILTGAFLEGAITRAALACLLEGFDVFACADLCETLDESHRHLYYARLRSFGGNVLTLRQLVLELMYGEFDPERQKRLAEIAGVLPVEAGALKG